MLLGKVTEIDIPKHVPSKELARTTAQHRAQYSSYSASLANIRLSSYLLLIQVPPLLPGNGKALAAKVLWSSQKVTSSLLGISISSTVYHTNGRYIKCLGLLHGSSCSIKSVILLSKSWTWDKDLSIPNIQYFTAGKTGFYIFKRNWQRPDKQLFCNCLY